MYPRRELTHLASHKVALRRRIAGHRARCVTAAARLTQPLDWLDRVMDFWRRVAPLAMAAGVSLGLLGARAIFSRSKALRWLVRWGPLVYGAGRRIGGLGLRRAEARRASRQFAHAGSRDDLTM
jgi:hypothetical protein